MYVKFIDLMSHHWMYGSVKYIFNSLPGELYMYDILQNTSEDMKGFYRDTSLINTHRSFPRLINNALYLYLYIPV